MVNVLLLLSVHCRVYRSLNVQNEMQRLLD